MVNATTGSGTAYTYNGYESATDRYVVGVANAHAGDANIPTVLYTHGAGGTRTQFSTLGAWSGLRGWLIDNGWAYIEADGGGTTSWGGPAARASYEDAVASARRIIDIGDIVVLGRSMGGLVAYWLATQSEFASDVVGLIINSRTTDLAYRYATGDATDKAQMQAAYAASDDASFAVNSVGFDPMPFASGVWAGKNVLQMYGTADTTVPAPANHAQAWVDEYGASVEYLGVDVRAGGSHSTTNGSYLQVDAMTAFLSYVNEVKGPPDPPGPLPGIVGGELTALYWVGPGKELFALPIPV
ncbi:S9 family peptidase [Microbacterium sp. ZXX196]|uniref:alpha/beta hydrolase family protein n=1 Tax=Microbacterium sp. ZXX196 TaxID=2609291 RepID=UPI0012B9E33B|nr:alpha/beta hydrolase [Microbacterium sp. ZXX196]MTE23270.1 alpha/beta hydrolase [Microbacterium sp. ZXX196]